MRTFLFYDLETSGLNKSFDQILQFAAVRTDANLKEIERHSFYVKLRCDVIPSPLASVTHRISIGQTLEGINEYEAVQKIHKIFNTPGTISIGYNTMGFDDEFLRFSFYRNLLPPYTHQFSNDCIRMDLFPLTIMYSLYKKDVLKWPEIDGRTSLKLENLNKENDLAKGQAHDASVDVDITIELARKLMGEKEMWNYLLKFFDKDEDLKRINSMPEVFQSAAGIHRLGIVSSSSFGYTYNFQAPALLIGNSIAYTNQYLWLRLDLPELRETTKDSVDENCYVIRKKLGEPAFLLPPKDRFLKPVGTKRGAEMDKNIKWLQSNPEIFKEIVDYYRNFKYENIPDLDVDTVLYQIGFMNSSEKKLCDIFHNLPPEEKTRSIENFKTRENKELAHRIMVRNYEDLVSQDQKDQKYRNEFMKKVNPGDGASPLIDFTKKEKTTPGAALKDLKALKNGEYMELDDEQKALVDELEKYILDNFS
jgi:exodeoxyribonuclease-1